mgnify:CR=1 FL=1
MGLTHEPRKPKLIIMQFIIENHGLTFLAGAYLTNRFGGSDGDYLALALDDEGQIFQFAGKATAYAWQRLSKPALALATWRRIVDNPWHGFESSWEATRRFLMDLGHLHPKAEPQEAQDWSVEGCRGHEGAVLASVKDQGTRLVLGTDHGSYFEALTIGEDGQAYRIISTTDGGALSGKLEDSQALALWHRLVNGENFTSRNDGVEAFLIWQGKKARKPAKAA